MEKAQITNRAGKATGKNYSWWNITNQDSSNQAIDLNAINCWEISDSPLNSNSKLVDRNPEIIDKNVEQSNDEKTIYEVFLHSVEGRRTQSKTDSTIAAEIQTSI